VAWRPVIGTVASLKRPHFRSCLLEVEPAVPAPRPAHGWRHLLGHRRKNRSDRSKISPRDRWRGAFDCDPFRFLRGNLLPECHVADGEAGNSHRERILSRVIRVLHYCRFVPLILASAEASSRNSGSTCRFSAEGSRVLASRSKTGNSCLEVGRDLRRAGKRL